MIYDGFKVGDREPFFLMAGPCVIESEALAMETAQKLKEITEKLGINFVYINHHLIKQIGPLLKALEG